MNKEIAKLREKWQETTLEPAIARFPERRERFETGSGIEVESVYTPADVGVDYLEDLGFPGQYPFTRGVYPTMYRGQLWTMRQYAGYATAEESNRPTSTSSPRARRASRWPLTCPPR